MTFNSLYVLLCIAPVLTYLIGRFHERVLWLQWKQRKAQKLLIMNQGTEEICEWLKMK